MAQGPAIETCLGVLQPGVQPFDPVELGRTIEKRVTQGDSRLYTRFGSTINYRTGIATGYTVGCSLRCCFCWSSQSRDRSDCPARFYSPTEAFNRLLAISRARGLDQVRISDAEPTIGKGHLLGLLALVDQTPYFRRFILESNGILLGADRHYVRDLAPFRKLVVRISIKAGTPEAFTAKTGADPSAFDLPFKALEHLSAERIPFWPAAMSADPRFMQPRERISLVARLARIDPDLVLRLEEEMVVLYPDTLRRLRAAGWDFGARKIDIVQRIPLLNRFFQVSYRPLRSIARRKISIGHTIKAIRELFHGT